jgi:hypothetical protein
VIVTPRATVSKCPAHAISIRVNRRLSLKISLTLANMFKTIYLSVVVAVLVLSGIWHISAPRITERWISRGNGIRLFGALLLELSIPCVWWGGWYYWVLFAGLTISGVLRLCFPQSSLRSIWPTYPNWVQTCLLLEGAALMWVLHS